jgi:hypothetical protein
MAISQFFSSKYFIFQEQSCVRVTLNFKFVTTCQNFAPKKENTGYKGYMSVHKKHFNLPINVQDNSLAEVFFFFASLKNLDYKVARL